MLAIITKMTLTQVISRCRRMRVGFELVFESKTRFGKTFTQPGMSEPAGWSEATLWAVSQNIRPLTPTLISSFHLSSLCHQPTPAFLIDFRHPNGAWWSRDWKNTQLSHLKSKECTNLLEKCLTQELISMKIELFVFLALINLCISLYFLYLYFLL